MRESAYINEFGINLSNQSLPYKSICINFVNISRTKCVVQLENKFSVYHGKKTLQEKRNFSIYEINENIGNEIISNLFFLLTAFTQYFLSFSILHVYGLFKMLSKILSFVVQTTFARSEFTNAFFI